MFVRFDVQNGYGNHTGLRTKLYVSTAGKTDRFVHFHHTDFVRFRTFQLYDNVRILQEIFVRFAVQNTYGIQTLIRSLSHALTA